MLRQGGHFALIKISQELITVNYDIKIAWDLSIKLQQQNKVTGTKFGAILF